MGKKNKLNPFAGKHVGGSTTATRLPSTGKKKKKQPAAAGGGGGGGASSSGGQGGGGSGKQKKPKSFLGLLAVGAGFAALWAWNIWSRGQQRQEDKRTLAAMARRPLAITDHAACRMDCRFIGREEIQEALERGRINARKSQPRLRPCPKYTVDATVGPRRKRVQVALAACPTETRVITVIDADTDWPCGPC